MHIAHLSCAHEIIQAPRGTFLFGLGVQLVWWAPLLAPETAVLPRNRSSGAWWEIRAGELSGAPGLSPVLPPAPCSADRASLAQAPPREWHPRRGPRRALSNHVELELRLLGRLQGSKSSFCPSAAVQF